MKKREEIKSLFSSLSSLVVVWLIQIRERTTTKNATKTMAEDWISDDALLAALASEPAPLHHLTGKRDWGFERGENREQRS